MKKEIFRFTAEAALALCALCFAANTLFGQEASEEKEQKSVQGELKIEGKFIKQLVLEREGGEKVTFDQPGESIKIAAGKYRLREVQLESGYACQEWMVPDQNWIEVGEDKPAVLKAGAPLKQILKAERQGRVLWLDYKLSGIGGEKYVNSDSNKPPTFTVYKGGKRIASGEFEYGGGGTCSYSWRVPLTAFGELRIVASADVGELGPKDSEAVTYDWKWYYSAPSLAIWAMLIAAIVAVKANRNPHALLIFVPLLIVNLLWSIFKKAMSFPSAEAEIFNMLFYSLTVGIAILWLSAHKLGNRNRFATFLLALIILIVVGITGAISYSGLEFSRQAVSALFLLAPLVLTMLLSLGLTGWWCRKSYKPVTFMLWLAVWTVAVNLVDTLVVYLTIFSVQRVPISIYTVLFISLVTSLILSAFLYVVVFPYMILALRSSFFRERFFACLHLKSMPTAASAPADKIQI